ncbi:MAG TPA: polyphosphate kinase 1, partial [Gammaproteobacteria bacterium]|nr:polyphosphate kinase 1 [Gammaproteobacteria bacterium]
PSFKPKLPGDLQRSDRMFAAITSGDILLNHPYESFQPVIYFLKQASRDPDVVAIKQTLYRTGTNSDILDLLVEAARNGKEVTAVVELRARFDEESNLEIAARLQEAGVVVVYGIVGHKTHAKMMLVVRREGAKLKRYVHLGTGNYHAGNARLYSDYSLLTCNEELAEDVHKIFQELTGMGRPAQLRHLYHSPFTLQQELLIQHIKQERDNALNGLPAKIIFKCNSLTEKEIIEELYRASQAGVEVKLIVRGMCCLRPGIAGVSENIEVRSIVGRFLEHTRLYYFHQNGEYSIYLASADLMERNLYRRVEISFPILDDKLRARTYKEGLEIYLKDNCQAWIMNSDGSYTRLQPQEGEERISAQHYLVEKLG